MFVIWHYVCRVVFPIILIGYFGCFLSPENQLASTLEPYLLRSIILIAVTGGIMALLVLSTLLKFACPICKQRETGVGGSNEEGLWLDCKHCGVTHESGFLKIGLTYSDPKNQNTDSGPQNS